MNHIAHKHPLVLNEIYIAKEDDACFVCEEKIFSCKSFVYSCSSIAGRSISTTEVVADDESCVKFLLHKNCAELPPTIQSPTNPEQFLELMYSFPRQVWESDYGFHCNSCHIPTEKYRHQLFYYIYDYIICTRCATIQVESSSEVHKFQHPAHSQHGPLALVDRPSSFQCDACNVDDNIKHFSYRCTKCKFWMHKACGDAPHTFHFHCHKKHPLKLAFSLPQMYLKFMQRCKLCRKVLRHGYCWLYYCPKCRFFAHFQCARSDQTSLRPGTIADEIYDSSLVQLPPEDQTLSHVLFKQFVKTLSTLVQNDDSDATLSQTSITKHWAHPRHPLELITITELNDGEEMLLQCDGCAKPISRSNGDDQLYGCVPCKFFMHRVCAEFPTEMANHPWGDTAGIVEYRRALYRVSRCDGCSLLCNGIFFQMENARRLHIGCVALPKIIKHEAHHHQLNEVRILPLRVQLPCSACRFKEGTDWSRPEWLHGCKQCDYYICAGCIMKPKRVKHRWDPHPLSLIYDPSMVSDHEHEFECEYCSEEIDTNRWFYHCSDCDLSFHLKCLQISSYSRYSDIKFGATDIVIKKLHPHSLTFVLNKKFNLCEKCGENQIGEPVFQCVPCKVIFCRSCVSFD